MKPEQEEPVTEPVQIRNWRDKIEEERRKREEEREERRIEMSDMFDLVREAIKVNSPVSNMNPDFMMSDLRPELLTNTVITYVREQLNIIEIINIFLDGEEDKVYRDYVNRILLNEVFTLIGLSRADRGKVINAILDYIKGSGGTAPTIEQPTEAKKEGIISRLNPFKGKQQTEGERT